MAAIARNLTADRSQETPIQAGTRRHQESEPPFRRDSRNCWQPEEKEMSICTRRPSCGGQETKSERAANCRAGERVVSLEVEVGVNNLRKKFLFVEGTHGSQRRLNAPLETGVQANKRPGAHVYPVGHYSEELQRTTARIGCRNSHLKSAPPGHCHMSDGAQTTQTFFFVKGTHVHWQATAEQFFFSKFNMHIMFI